MSFVAMWKELALDLGSMPGALVRTKINEALGSIYDEAIWSFQIVEGGWLTAPLMSQGTITVTPYQNQVVGDAVATAAWLALVGRPFLTEQQFRIPNFDLYNIIAYDDGQDPDNSPNFPFATLTLDRLWMEPPQTAQGYMIYQAYYPVPVPDFKRFLTISDFTNTRTIDFRQWKQADLQVHDPQRTIFQFPTRAVPYQTDSRVNSATFGNMMYELWPGPLSVLPYAFSFLRRGPVMVKNDDTVPYPLTEELVKWRAKELSYLWKESQKGEDMQRGSGADWKFLAQAANAEYKKLLKDVMKRDRDMVDLYTTKLRRKGVAVGPFFNSTGTGLTLGGF